jgi:hypothetical protein
MQAAICLKHRGAAELFLKTGLRENLKPHRQHQQHQQ